MTTQNSIPAKLTASESLTLYLKYVPSREGRTMWTVALQNRAGKQYKALPARIRDKLHTLILSMRHTGPVQGAWPNYGKLDTTRHHCHLKKGKPCYVAVWEVVDKMVYLIEVTYVGTHENAPYS